MNVDAPAGLSFQHVKLTEASRGYFVDTSMLTILSIYVIFSRIVCL